MDDPGQGRKSLRIDVAIGSLAAAFQVACALLLSGSVDPLYGDAADYHRLAGGLAHSLTYGPPQAVRPPGWPIVLGFSYWVFGSLPIVGIALNAVLIGLSFVMLVQLGQTLGLTTNQGRAAGLGYCLFPWVLVVGSTLYAEIFFNFLLILLCWVVVRVRSAHQISSWWWIAPGLIAGYSCLVRPVMAFWLPAGLLFALSRQVKWRAAIAATLGIVLILTPWTIRNYQRLGSFVPLSTNGGNTLMQANNDTSGAGMSEVPPVSGDEATWDPVHRQVALNWVKQHPGEFAKRVPQRLVRTLDPAALGASGVVGSPTPRWAARGLWLCALIAIAIGLIKRHRRNWLVPLSIVTFVALLPVTVYGGAFRFLMPALPFFALWAVVGIRGIWDYLTERQRSVPLVDVTST